MAVKADTEAVRKATSTKNFMVNLAIDEIVNNCGCRKMKMPRRGSKSTMSDVLWLSVGNHLGQKRYGRPLVFMIQTKIPRD